MFTSPTRSSEEPISGAQAILFQTEGEGVFRAGLGPDEDVLVRRLESSWQIASVPVLTGGFGLDDEVRVEFDDILGLVVDGVVARGSRVSVRVGGSSCAGSSMASVRTALMSLGSDARLGYVPNVGFSVSHAAECEADSLSEAIETTLVRFGLTRDAYELGRGRGLDGRLQRDFGYKVLAQATVSEMSPPEPVNDIQRKVVTDVKRHGWHSISVGEGPDWDGPAFGYTIGLQAQYAHPELVVVGFDAGLGHAVRRGLVEAIQEGASFSPGDRSDAALEGLDVRFRRVDVAAVGDWLVLGHWYYGQSTWSVLQVLWPDREGAYPDEVTYDRDGAPQLLL